MIIEDYPVTRDSSLRKPSWKVNEGNAQRNEEAMKNQAKQKKPRPSKSDEPMHQIPPTKTDKPLPEKDKDGAKQKPLRRPLREISANARSTDLKTKQSKTPMAVKNDEELASLLSHRTNLVDAQDSLAFAEILMKENYDKKHTPRFFKTGDMVNIRLHRGYKLPSLVSRKYAPLFTGPFRVVKRIGRLAYKLDIPTDWKIHPVISVAHLEPASMAMNGQSGVSSTFPNPLTADESKFPVSMDRIVAKRKIKQNDKWLTEYRIRFDGLDSTRDAWVNVKELDRNGELLRQLEQRMADEQANALDKDMVNRELAMIID